MDDEAHKVLNALSSMRRYRAVAPLSRKQMKARQWSWYLLGASAGFEACLVVLACWTKFVFPLIGIGRVFALTVMVAAMLLSVLAILVDAIPMIVLGFRRGNPPCCRLILERKHDYQYSHQLSFFGSPALTKANAWLASLIARNELHLEAVVDDPKKLAVFSLVGLAISLAGIAPTVSGKLLSLDLPWRLALFTIGVSFVVLLVAKLVQLRGTHRRYMYYKDLVDLAISGNAANNDHV
jgi:hypothetical protein